MYGSTLSDSEIASSLLKVGEIYPDSSGGSDQITYTYNRQQQVLVVTDQGGTEHTYAYDALGRVTQDRATALGSGVDGTVRRIGRTYDARGLVESVSSYDNPAVGSGTVLNAVQFAYNGFGQLITESVRIHVQTSRTHTDDHTSGQRRQWHTGRFACRCVQCQ